MDPDKLKQYVEAALLAAGQPMTLAQLNGLFDEDEQPGHSLLRQSLAALDAELEGRAVELVEVAGGYRLQVRQKLMPVISKMWAEKPPKYSRALLETLAIIAYRQPITRGEIEQIRGVSLSANILKTLQEREWIKTVGHRDVPGKPELLGTTREFLDYFNLKGLDDLPTLAEIRDLDNLEPELQLADPDRPASERPNDEQANEAEPEGPQEPDERDEQHLDERPDAPEDPVDEETGGDEEGGDEEGEVEAGDTGGRDDEEDDFEGCDEEDDEEDDGPEPRSPDFDADEDDDEPDDAELEDGEQEDGEQEAFDEDDQRRPD
ncbi:SMC-Scp complex subunit ScpB [Wenzhouxiangella sp. XN79A]|uniref:SMC-Scp complex subunit ScpB n=1 Tax=Wenzhouxiangella sp. XN79A TaxID=2724193 RepID=UPI0032167AA0